MKKTIQRMLLLSIGVVVAILLLLTVIRNVIVKQNEMVKSSEYLFWQIDNVMVKNEQDSEETIQQIYSSGITRAKSVAYMIQDKQKTELTAQYMQELAGVVDVDEIHLFNEAGFLFASTSDKWIGLTLSSGEQIQFFQQMLKDKELTLCQEAMPNTGEGKMMQYVAVWSPDKKTIVQVGVAPERLEHVTDANQIPYIFSMLTDSSDSILLAVEKETYKVIGATKEEVLGHSIDQLGISTGKMTRLGKGFHFVSADGGVYYGVFEEYDDLILGRAVPTHNMYRGVIGNSLNMLFVAVVIIGIVCYIVSKYIDEKIVYAINEINQDLQLITGGDLNVEVKSEMIPEFKEMGAYINEMVDLMRKDLYQDQLTGLYSRRAFYFELEKYFNHVKENQFAALIMVDADYLKYVNDVYGHETGDEYLRRITELIGRLSCKDKLIARLGGDEFAVLIPNAESEEQMQAYYEECMQLREGVKLTISSQLEIPILFSVGMATYPKDGDNYHVLLKEADNRMFQDKQERKKKSGRQNGR